MLGVFSWLPIFVQTTCTIPFKLHDSLYLYKLHVLFLSNFCCSGGCYPSDGIWQERPQVSDLLQLKSTTTRRPGHGPVHTEHQHQARKKLHVSGGCSQGEKRVPFFFTLVIIVAVISVELYLTSKGKQAALFLNPFHLVPDSRAGCCWTVLSACARLRVRHRNSFL